MPKIQAYEAHADFYEQWFKDNQATFHAELQAVQMLLPNGKGVEIGAGSGLFSDALNINTGIEPSKAMRSKAQTRGLSFIDGVAESLPIADNQFDYAIFITSVCFLDDVATSFKEAARVTKPDGSIIVAYLERNSELGQVYEKHKQDSPFYKDATFYSHQEITDRLTQAGFGHFQSVQTILADSCKQPKLSVTIGHELGAFVVIRARKLDS